MNIASYIDHTILRPDCTIRDIEQICGEASTHSFKAVCVPPYFVPSASQLLKDVEVKIATVIGFPMGYGTVSSKVEEIKRALNDGADEVDVVINIAATKNGDWTYVRNDIDSVTRAVHLKGKAIKLILETGLLDREEIIKLCELATVQPAEENQNQGIRRDTGLSDGPQNGTSRSRPARKFFRDSNHERQYAGLEIRLSQNRFQID